MAFLNDAMRAQLEPVFAKLKRKVTIVTIVDRENPKCLELEEAVTEIAALSPLLTAKAVDKGTEPELESRIHANRFPIAAFLDADGNYSGVKFHGVPGGQEINSFVMSLYNFSGDGQSIPRRLEKKIKAIDQPVNIKVGISLACHYCPGVVVAAQRMAILNPNIEAEMIDATLYQDFVDQFHIERVPAIVWNDKEVVFGAKDLEELLELISRG